MNWFVQLKQCLPEYYPGSGRADVIGYLRGSGSAAVWKQMEARRPQMIVLGNTEPNHEDWVAAGVPHRVGETQVVTIDQCGTFIILYAGFVRRPWGSIVTLTAESLKVFPASIDSMDAQQAAPAVVCGALFGPSVWFAACPPTPPSAPPRA